MAAVDWLYEEVLLAADLAYENGWSGLRATDPKVIALSDLLRSVDLHGDAEQPDDFRSPSGVQRKTYDLATAHPDYAGKPTRSSKLDHYVLAEFLADPVATHAKAAVVRTALQDGEAPSFDDPEIDMTAIEGGLLLSIHKRRERDPKLRAAKLAKNQKAGKPVACEVCGIDFGATYGERGKGYIEVHHIEPLYVTGQKVTTLDDLALLCANCHRMVHRSPLVTPTELAKIVASQDLLGTPNCESCLVPMELAGDHDGPRWVCPNCGIVRLA